jgi:hypothetical protein
MSLKVVAKTGGKTDRPQGKRQIAGGREEKGR